MTKKLLLIIALGCLFAGYVSAQKIEWKTIEQAAKVNPKNSAKLYFVDFYTTWCGWCKKMDRTTFTDPTVSKILSAYFIPVKFDAEGSVEFVWNGVKYANAATAPGGRASTHSFAKKMLGTQMGFPSFGIFASNQSQLTVIQGYQTPEDLVVMLWYFASGDYKHYAYEKYAQIFDKEIRPTMNQKLGIQ